MNDDERIAKLIDELYLMTDKNPEEDDLELTE